MKKVLHASYHFIHDLLFLTIAYNPFFRKHFKGKKIKKGFIADEHLTNPELDEVLIKDLKNLGIKTSRHRINMGAYKKYLSKASYPRTYFGGGDEKNNFTEKTLEHYVSTEFIEFKPKTTFIDIAACTSPFYQLVKILFGVKVSYQQDLIFKKGLHGNKIGGSASALPLHDNSVDAATLHCSLEHFENNHDTEFFLEMNRVLKQGGKVVVLPFYLAYEYTIHIDPIFNFLRFHHPKRDPEAQLRYCNWYQHHSRHYSPVALKKRILNNVPNLELEIFKVENFREINDLCYLRFVGVFTKK